MKRLAKLKGIERTARFSRTEPQVKYGPGLRLKVNTAGRRVLIERCKRLRKPEDRTGFLFWAILTGALPKHEVDAAFPTEKRSAGAA